jgi:hypothetical protein
MNNFIYKNLSVLFHVKKIVSSKKETCKYQRTCKELGMIISYDKWTFIYNSCKLILSPTSASQGKVAYEQKTHIIIIIFVT